MGILNVPGPNQKNATPNLSQAYASRKIIYPVYLLWRNHIRQVPHILQYSRANIYSLRKFKVNSFCPQLQARDPEHILR